MDGRPCLSSDNDPRRQRWAGVVQVQKIFHPSTIIGAAQDGGPGKDADCGGHDQGARPSGEDASHNQNDP